MLLATGELARIGVGLLGYAHPGELAHGHLGGFGLGAAPDLALGQGDVLDDGQVGEQVELLEHHSHLGPDVVEVGRSVCQLVAVDGDRARGRDFQQVDAAQHGGLARAAGADDDQHLALGHVQVQVAYCVDGPVECLGDAPQTDHRFCLRRDGLVHQRSPFRSRVIRRSSIPSSRDRPRVRIR